MRRVRVTSRALLLAAALLGATASAPAQSPQSAGGAQVSTRVSAREVEVGERVVVSVTALSSQDGASPASPRLPVTGNAEVNGPSLRTEFRMFSDGRTMQRQQGVTATWTITPLEPGTITIGPGTFELGDRTITGERITIQVSPASASPRRSPPPSMGRGRGWPDPFDFDPFDWMRRRRPPGMDQDPFPDWLQPQVPPELQVDRAPDPIGFARMDSTPRRVVLGEQVTLRIYAYGGRGSFSVGFVTQPSTPDFLSYPIEQDDLVPHRVPIGGQVFHAAKLREVALIPLKTGQLEIGGAELVLSGRGYPGTGPQGGFLTKSAPLSITVEEPPLAGRPPGYVLGDVGRYELTATVEPRRVEQGELVSVTARLKGTGNVPSRLSPAENQALEWLEPTVTGSVEALGTKVGGERVFRWAVRAKKAGEIELGELRLPYYDPERRRYETATAALGTIEVLPNAEVERAQEVEEQLSAAGELTPRSELGEFPPPRWWWTDSASFWWVLFGVPLSIPLLAGVHGGVRLLLSRWRRGAGGARDRVAAHLKTAATQRESGDTAAAASSYERAIYEAIEAATGVKGRGLLLDELPGQLQERGLDPARARELAELLEALQTLRFTGQGDPVALGHECEVAVRALAQRRSRRRQSAPEVSVR
ncbi:MAG: protein BatD [Myxococcales bacterium]|nr:protein BatD [Myxococcales bacterium]